MPHTLLSAKSMALPGLAVLYLGLTVCAVPALAQTTYELQLGSPTNSTVSGQATISTAGDTAGGTYQYYDGSASPAPLPSGPNTVQFLYAYGSSTATINSGALAEVDAHGSSTINFNGGSIQRNGDGDGGFLQALGTSTANISGGQIRDIGNDPSAVLNLSGSFVSYAGIGGTLNMSGGQIADSSVGSVIYKGGTANVSGGTIKTLQVLGTVNLSGTGSINELDLGNFTDDSVGGTANISGGTVGNLINGGTSTATITGGLFTTLVGSGTSVYDLFGTDFLETPTGTSVFQLTGTLANGDQLDAQYFDNGGSLVFHDVPPVPEASTTVSLGLLLGLGGLLLWRKKKAAL